MYQGQEPVDKMDQTHLYGEAQFGLSFALEDKHCKAQHTPNHHSNKRYIMCLLASRKQVMQDLGPRSVKKKNNLLRFKGSMTRERAMTRISYHIDIKCIRIRIQP